MIPGSVVMGLVLMVDPWAKNVEFSGGVAFEVRGGSAPLQAGQPAEPALRLSLAPTAVMVYQDRVRSREARLEYSPQAFFRISEQYFAVSQLRRPLFFHQMRAQYGAQLSPRVSWQAGVGANVGEMDFSIQSASLGSTDTGAAPAEGVDGSAQGTLLDEPVVRTGGVSGGISLTHRLTPLHSLSIGPSFTVQRLLTELPSDGSAGFTFNQTSGDLALAHAAVLSRVDTLTTTVVGGYADFSARGTQAYASLGTAWRRALRPRLDSQLTGGVFYTLQVEQPETNAGQQAVAQGIPLLPTFDYLLTGRVLQRSRLRITTNVNAGTRAYFDPVQGSVLPLAGGGASLSFFMPPDLTVGASASFYTPPTAPSDLDASNPAAGRSAISVATPVNYQIRPNLSMEAGTIFTGRGPHLSLVDGGDPFPIREFWVYVSFRVFFSTGGTG